MVSVLLITGICEETASILSRSWWCLRVRVGCCSSRWWRSTKKLRDKPNLLASIGRAPGPLYPRAVSSAILGPGGDGGVPAPGTVDSGDTLAINNNSRDDGYTRLSEFLLVGLKM